MAGNIGDSGFLRIENGDDRAMVASVLFKNGYTVSTTRKKRNGKAYEYYVKYELRDREMSDNE